MVTMPPTNPDASTEQPEDADDGTVRPYHIIEWKTLPDLKHMTWSTVIEVMGRRFFAYSPEMILKLDTDEGEAAMTNLAYTLLGRVVPRVDAVVRITEPRPNLGILITHQPGKPLFELWPTLEPTQRTRVKENLASLLIRMRAPHESLNYYGRPGRQSYVAKLSLYRPKDVHSFCRTRAEWDESRIHALRLAAPEADLDEGRVRELQRIQYETCKAGSVLVDSPVLIHVDLSDRNTLADPVSLELTGLIDWKRANVAPAYFEYAAARLCGGHLPEWRAELMDVLQMVLRVECERETARRCEITRTQPTEEQREDLFKETLAAWNALLDVERPAQGYSGACYWTFDGKDRRSWPVSGMGKEG